MSYASNLKLQPILDQVDSGNYKQGIALCTKALKKQPDALNLKALKAFCLERTGRRDEALEISLEVKAAAPKDDITLQAVSGVFTRSGKYKDLADMYDAAYKAQPSNEEFGNHLFMAKVRLNDPKALQPIAMKLQKTFKADKYLFWTVMSLYLQVVASLALSNCDDQAKSLSSGPVTVLLTLAERMMAKAAEEKKIVRYEELQLYLMILEAIGKHEEALKIISGDLGKACKVEFERERLKLEFAKRLSDTDAVIELAMGMIRLSLDDWECYKQLIEASFNSKEEDKLVERRERVKLFVNTLVKEATPDDLKRAPFLAQLDILRRFGDIDGIIARSKDYFSKFGGTLVFFDDISCIVKELNDTEKGKVIMAIFENYEAPKPYTVDGIRRDLNRWKLFVFFNLLESKTARSDAIKELLEIYYESVSLGDNLEVTERQYGDDAILMVTQLLLLDLDRQDPKSYLTAAAVLEYALKKSKYNFQMKIFLIYIYKRLGAALPILDISSTLDIKHMLHDTLTHLFADKLEQIAPANDFLPRLLMAMTIYQSNNTETPDMIVKAYNFGTYSKIPEFLEFQDNLQFSLQRALMRRQILKLELLRRNEFENIKDLFGHVAQEDFEFSEEFVSSKYDNRDRTIAKSCMNQQVFQLFEDFENSREDLKIDTICLNIVKSILEDSDNTELLKSLESIYVTNGKSKDVSVVVLIACAQAVQSKSIGQDIVKPLTEVVETLDEAVKSGKWTPNFETIGSLTATVLSFRYLSHTLHLLSRANKGDENLKSVTLKAKELSERFSVVLTSIEKQVKESVAPDTGKFSLGVDLPLPTNLAGVLKDTVWSSVNASWLSSLKFLQNVASSNT
ncbi:N-alpha-acetyltransferase 25, NatB auxiliary subunit, partial [Phlyctochytrium planicorne]